MTTLEWAKYVEAVVTGQEIDMRDIPDNHPDCIARMAGRAMRAGPGRAVLMTPMQLILLRRKFNDGQMNMIYGARIRTADA